MPCVLLFGGCADRGPDIVPGVSLELAEHRATTISDVSYGLDLDIRESPDEPIQGRVNISFWLSDNSMPVQLDFRESGDKILAVESNGAVSQSGFENEHIVIPANELVVGRNLVSIRFIAGTTSLNRNPEFLYTLFVPDRARTAFPLFDQPDLKATYDLQLSIPAGWTAMSNAPVASVTRGAGLNTFRFAATDPISSYLFSFVAGKFETIERDVSGRPMVMLHRETDEEKVARNVDAIFELHSAALDWLEDYTGISYPYQKFDFVLIPSFQYGGMEHVGAIQYRADSLFLDESPSDTQLLGRAGLIAHETAHMWFGNLVTMEWFNDVWTKEVFANFMAAKIVNPGFPEINHDLNFLVRHYPAAYSVDRTSGANPIRQYLPNLNEAGQMYGAIIYNKAPIMMRQLEMLIGADLFQEGMREYLAQYAFANATWPALIDILDRKSEHDLKAWSEVWVNTPGRPDIAPEVLQKSGGAPETLLVQHDHAGLSRAWPQSFSVTALSDEHGDHRFAVTSSATSVPFDGRDIPPAAKVIFNSDGVGYGVFPTSFEVQHDWQRLSDLEKGSALINLYEQMLLGNTPAPLDYFDALGAIVASEENQLLLNLSLGQVRRIFWQFLPETTRDERAPGLEALLWDTMLAQSEGSMRKIYFDAFSDIAISPDGMQKVHDVWSGLLVVEGLPLSENDHIALAQDLAIKLPGRAEEIIAAQLGRTQNPDNRRKLGFIAPSLSADSETRDRFVASLANEENRAIESWVLDALQNIHHPLRTSSSERYILPSLLLLQEIQVTGDIFFPKRWLDVTLGNYRTGTAVNTVNTFLAERPAYNEQLRMKILQSADTMFRASTLAGADDER